MAQPEVGQVADKGARGAAVGQRVAPEHPLERDDGADHERLEQQRQRRRAPRQAAVQQADARQDRPHDEGAGDQVRVVPLVAGVLGVHVGLEGVAARGHGFVETGLFEGESQYQFRIPLLVAEGFNLPGHSFRQSQPRKRTEGCERRMELLFQS